ncbi:olfactory receptor 8D4-like [Bufo gargarizans]|uniref:olfactory receptor 8D4-like n=1 Tax=Bufo gargarizans TaxID=30331 RepID=UPI001CF33BA7|nr:olfactory receptor 8D4-like [Bufo gargarizans]
MVHIQHGKSMNVKNESQVMEFTLSGIAYSSHWKSLIFTVFLTIFVMTILGNSLIVLVVRQNISLHTPMYFFLSNLSFVELCYTSITIPNILSGIIRGSGSISFSGCIVQVYLFTLCATAECILLVAMAFDRYVAICRPLRYTVIINRMVCAYFAIFAWLSGVLNSTINTVVISNLNFCGSKFIDRLYCEGQPLVRLSCSDTHLSDILATLSAAVFGVICLLFILMSYFFILLTIVKMPSRSSRHKTFSTCTSHITVVVLYFGALIFMYLLPSDSSSQQLDLAVSMIYSTVTPMLNPIIYSLRNHQVIGALNNMMRCNSSLKPSCVQRV